MTFSGLNQMYWKGEPRIDEKMKEVPPDGVPEWVMIHRRDANGNWVCDLIKPVQQESKDQEKMPQ